MAATGLLLNLNTPTALSRTETNGRLPATETPIPATTGSACARPAAALLVLAFMALWLTTAPSFAAIPERERDPVILTGSDLPGLEGIDPDRLVAFRRSAGSWDQVPVQVDERREVDFRSLYPFTGGFVSGGPVVINAYADPGTLAGADPDPGIDGDDEIALMAADTGPRVPASYGGRPEGTLGTGATGLRVEDPQTGKSGYVYLFESDGPADQSAGQDYVDYDFNLASGDYLSGYDFRNGPNPETSRVETDFYETGHSDRWINDELRLKTAGASGVDILDREKAQFGPGVCGRSTGTFSSAEGSFLVNRDGPVRAIRSFIGANSGPYTQREHVYYQRRHDARTFLRVHAIPGVMQFTDYSPEATGMTYRNQLNPGGVTIDGVPDSPVPGLPDNVLSGEPMWEQVSGEQGSLDVITQMETDVNGLGITSYYLDDSVPEEPEEEQCAGDPSAYGSSGTWINTPIPNTDPRSNTYRSLEVTKTSYYEGPQATTARAESRRQQVAAPLTVTSSALAPSVGKARIVTGLSTRKVKVRAGGKSMVRVRLRNTGQSRSARIKVCARVRGAGFRTAGRRCRTSKGLSPGRRSVLKFRFKAPRQSAGRARGKVSFTVRHDGNKLRVLTARVRLR